MSISFENLHLYEHVEAHFSCQNLQKSSLMACYFLELL